MEQLLHWCRIGIATGSQWVSRSTVKRFDVSLIVPGASEAHYTNYMYHRHTDVDTCVHFQWHSQLSSLLYQSTYKWRCLCWPSLLGFQWAGWDESIHYRSKLFSRRVSAFLHDKIHSCSVVWSCCELHVSIALSLNSLQFGTSRFRRFFRFSYNRLLRRIWSESVNIHVNHNRC